VFLWWWSSLMFDFLFHDGGLLIAEN